MYLDLGLKGRTLTIQYQIFSIPKIFKEGIYVECINNHEYG